MVEINWQNAPDWLKSARERRPHLMPEVAQEEARRDHMRALVEVQHETTKQEELKLQQEEKKNERERLKRGASARAPIDPNKIKLEFAMNGDTETAKVQYLVDPFLPAKCAVGFFGRGGTAKSSFLATMAAMISSNSSTLWISSEELTDWIKARHVRAGGRENTLLVFKGIEADGERQAVQIFGVYEHLDSTITMAQVSAQNVSSPPIRLVVLDTAVALTIWPSGQGPNDDASVKRLMAYLQMLAEKHDVTIAFVGHNNKRSSQSTEHFEDMVAGALAWVTSPRVAFIHARDNREEHSYVMRLAKPQLTQRFLVTYSTQAIHTLSSRWAAPDSVLCKAVLGKCIWGEAESGYEFNAATGKGDTGNGDGFADTRTPTLADKAIQALVEMVMTTQLGENITREDVEQRIGKRVDSRRWIQVDAHLLNHPTVLKEYGPQNRVLYRKR